MFDRQVVDSAISFGVDSKVLLEILNHIFDRHMSLSQGQSVTDLWIRLAHDIDHVAALQFGLIKDLDCVVNIIPRDDEISHLDASGRSR